MTSTTGVVKYDAPELTVITAASAMKIRTLPPNHQDDRLTSCLQYVFRLIGLKKLPNETDTVVLKEFILTEWSHVTIEEIAMAFRMYAKQELDDCPESFQNFNTVYFSRIMQSYIRFRVKEFKLHNALNPARPKEKEATDEEKLEKKKEYCKNCLIESYKKSEPIFNGAWMFKSLEKIGVIKLTSDQKDGVLKRAQEVYANQLKAKNTRENAKTIKSIIANGPNADQKEAIKKIAREIALADWLREKKTKKVSAEDLEKEVMKALES